MLSRLVRKPHRAGWVLLLGSVLALTACGGSASSGSSTASTPSTAPTTSSARATPTPTVNVAAAVAAALRLYSRSPNNLNDPSAGYIWSSSTAEMPVSTELRDRLVWLNNHDYFDDRHCAEDYINGNQVGLTRAPKAISATPNSDGTVTVVIRGHLNNSYRDLTIVMSQIHGTWLATDLHRGTGPNASIFSTHPNC